MRGVGAANTRIRWAQPVLSTTAHPKICCFSRRRTPPPPQRPPHPISIIEFGAISSSSFCQLLPFVPLNRGKNGVEGTRGKWYCNGSRLSKVVTFINATVSRRLWHRHLVLEVVYFCVLYLVVNSTVLAVVWRGSEWQDSWSWQADSRFLFSKKKYLAGSYLFFFNSGRKLMIGNVAVHFNDQTWAFLCRVSSFSSQSHSISGPKTKLDSSHVHELYAENLGWLTGHWGEENGSEPQKTSWKSKKRQTGKETETTIVFHTLYRSRRCCTAVHRCAVTSRIPLDFLDRNDRTANRNKNNSNCSHVTVNGCSAGNDPPPYILLPH